MPKKIDPQLPARCVRLVREHQQEYPTLTTAVTAVARQKNVSRESVRRWLAQAEVDDGTRLGITSEESAEVKRLQVENRRLREDNEILRVLRRQGLGIIARTYRAWKNPVRITTRTVADALVEDKIRDMAWTFNEVTGQIQITPEGLYGRRKWIARCALSGSRAFGERRSCAPPSLIRMGNEPVACWAPITPPGGTSPVAASLATEPDQCSRLRSCSVISPAREALALTPAAMASPIQWASKVSMAR